MKKITLLLLVLSINVYAAKIIFTNNNEQTNITGNASIDSQTGDILVETSVPALITTGSAVLSVFPDTYEATPNQTIAMNYTVVNGKSCVGSSNRGTVANWTGSLSSSDGTFTKSVNVGSQFPIDFTVTCTNKVNNGTVTDTVTIIQKVNTQPGVAPAVTVRANGGSSNISVTSGSSVALTYVITDNDLACTFTSSPLNSTWNALNSSGSSTSNTNVTVSTASTYTISCTNSSGLTDSDSITISVIGNAACSSHPAPPGTAVQSGLSYSTLMGSQFGVSSSGSANFSIDKNKYAAIPVTSPSGLVTRKLSFEQATANFTPAEYTVSISKCPGDFQVNSLEVGKGKCVTTPGITPVMKFSTKTSPSGLDLATKCILDRNEQYYINIIHSIASPYSNSVCTNAIKCGVLFTEALDN